MVTSLAQKDQILSLLQDPYANYVVQRALQVSSSLVLHPLLLLFPSLLLLSSFSPLPPPPLPSFALPPPH
jgi:hypothetical protein